MQLAIEFAESMGKAIIGMDPLCNEQIFAKTVSAIDMAVWDIKAKAANLPLYKLLGGARDRVDCYVTGDYYAPEKGIKELQEEYLSWGTDQYLLIIRVLFPTIRAVWL